MKLLLINFAIVALSQARYTDPICDDVLVHNIHHEKEILVDNKEYPYQLVIDYHSQVLFFSYSNKNSDELFTSALFNLKTNEFSTISGIDGGFANTVDEKKHIVYLGSGNGLYTFDYETKSASHVDGVNHNIWQMFFMNDIYYSTYPDEEVYIYKNGHSERVPELANTKAMLVGLNKDLDFYFSNSSGLFKLKKSDRETVYLGDYSLNSITADNNGNLYFTTPSKIYFINENDNIEEIASLPDIYGVAIENDGNIIYASDKAVVRLKPTKSPCYLDEKKTNSRNNNKI